MYNRRKLRESVTNSYCRKSCMTLFFSKNGRSHSDINLIPSLTSFEEKLLATWTTTSMKQCQVEEEITGHCCQVTIQLMLSSVKGPKKAVEETAQWRNACEKSNKLDFGGPLLIRTVQFEVYGGRCILD